MKIAVPIVPSLTATLIAVVASRLLARAAWRAEGTTSEPAHVI